MTKRSLHADTHGRQSPVWSATPGTGEVVRRLELTKGALRCGTSSRGSLQGSPRQASKLTQARGQPNKAWRVKPPLRRAKSGKRKSTRSGAVGGQSLVPRPPSPVPSTRGQEQASVEQPLRSGSGREDSNLGREHPQHRATDVPPAPFGSKRGKRVRPPTRAREAQEQQTLRQIIPATQ